MIKLEEDLRLAIKNALLEKHKDSSNLNKIRYITLKNILETAQKVAKEKKIEELSETMIVDAVKKEIKQLNELLIYCQDNTDKKYELFEGIKIAEQFLPEMISEEKLIEFVNKHKEEYQTVGMMMKALKEEFNSSVDMKLASKIVKENL